MQEYSMVNLNKVSINSSTSGDDISLADNLANSTASNISLVNDFYLDNSGINIELEHSTVRVGEQTRYLIEFNGTNGRFASNYIIEDNNYEFSYRVADGRITIDTVSTTASSISFSIGYDMPGTVDFELHSSSDFITAFGWDIFDKHRGCEFSITWT